MGIGLRHLRYAVAAEQYGSIRRAAAALGLKPSTLSRSIKQMEERLEVTVFERTNSGLTLTAAGAEIMRTSRHLVDGVDHMMLTAKTAGRDRAIRLSVGFYASLFARHIRAVLVEYAHRFPDVDIHLVEADRDKLFVALEHGTLDIAIVTGDIVDEEKNTMALWNERIAVALPKNHRLASGEIVYWTDLRGEIVLLSERDPGPELKGILLTKLPSQVARPHVVSKDVSFETILGLVGAGCGVGLNVESALGVVHEDVVVRELHDGAGASFLTYHACWQGETGPAAKRPALSNFLTLLDERYPSLPARTVKPAAPSQIPDRPK